MLEERILRLENIRVEREDRLQPEPLPPLEQPPPIVPDDLVIDEVDEEQEADHQVEVLPVRNPSCCQQFLMILAWPFIALFRTFRYYYVNMFCMALNQIFKPGIHVANHPIRFKFLTLVLDFVINSAVLYFTYMAATYDLGGSDDDPQIDDSPFPNAKQLNLAIQTSQFMFAIFFIEYPIIFVLAFCMISQRQDTQELTRRKYMELRQRYPNKKCLCLCTVRKPCDYIKSSVVLLASIFNLHLILYVLLGGFKPMQKFCRDQIVAIQFRNAV